jgi:hypothetical protein
MGVAAWLRFRREQAFIYPDERGLLPVPATNDPIRSDVYRAALAALAAQHQTMLEAAGNRSVPVHYAPHISIAGREGASALPEQPQGADGEQPVSVPSFAQLLESGRVGRGQPLLLGFDLGTGAAIEGAWLDVYSSALAGMPSSGKTTSQRFMAAQLALWGARFVVCDPHAGAGDDSLAATIDPLRSTYLVEPAEDAEAILQAIRYVDSIGAARIAGHDQGRDPVVLWVDELNGLLADDAVGPELLKLLKETSRQYRKVSVFLSCVAHTWSASSTGRSSDLRANFASRMCHRMERGQARILVPNDLATRAERLEPGQAVLHTMRHSTIVQVPLTTGDDVARVAGLLTDGSATMPRLVPQPATETGAAPAAEIGGAPTSGDSGSGHPKALDARAEMVRRMMVEKRGQNEIIKEIWHVEPSTRAGKKALEELRDIQAQIVALHG